MVYQKKLANDLDLILQQLAIFINDIVAIAIESTFNWYWLVDGLKAAGYEVKLVNTAAVQTYSGLKHTDDKDDARWLAHLLRLGILPTGYIYPKEERAVRDLLRKRSQLVRQSTTNILSAQNILTRNTTQSLTAAKLKKIADEEINKLFDDPNITLALKSNINIIRSLQTSIKEIEQVVVSQVRLRPEYQQLLSVSGIGQALGLTIMLETGEISRFNKVGNYSSYCRCVKSERLSNGKKKGENNRKNGNKYLAWAFMEAGHYGAIWDPRIKRFYERKKAKVHIMVAKKAVASKLARACYHMLKRGEEFDVTRAFS